MSSTLRRLPQVMSAVVKAAPTPAGVSVTEVAVPVPPSKCAKVRVLATGICGTDVHIAHDEYATEAPVVMGHEVTGVVVEVGDASDRHWVGRRVACETYFSTCSHCRWCRRGQTNLCPDRRSIGSFEDGGFADYIVVPVLNLHGLPEWLGDLEGALAEPLACVAHCLLDPPVLQAGDHVLVTGPGAMGQLAAQVAQALGARVTLSGLPRDAERLAVAAALGVETTTEPVAADTFDVVLEASGSAGGAAVAFRSVRRGGRYVQIGIFGREVTVPLDTVLYKELTITSGFASTPTSWRTAIRLIEQRRVTLAPLVTKQVALADFPEALAAAERAEGLKTVVTPT